MILHLTNYRPRSFSNPKFPQEYIGSSSRFFDKNKLLSEMLAVSSVKSMGRLCVLTLTLFPVFVIFLFVYALQLQGDQPKLTKEDVLKVHSHSLQLALNIITCVILYREINQ